MRTGDMYAWTGHGNGSTAYTQNGLNQQVTIGGAAASWDAKGNLTSEPQSGKTYGYSSENLLTSASGGVTLGYDPWMRLYQVAGVATTRFAYDGTQAIAEYDAGNALQRRFVFDPTTGQPVVWYEGTGVASTDRRYLSTDERGSVISASGSTGASLGLNSYDEYGKPGAANLGRFQYTGQMWIGEAGVYAFPARNYVAQLGVFAQTDPVGNEDIPNLYAYAHNDPMNNLDPTGLETTTVECHAVWVWVGTGNTQTSPPPNAPPVGSAGWEQRQFCQRVIVPGGNGPQTGQPRGASGGPQSPPPPKQQQDPCYSGENDSQVTGAIAGSGAIFAFEAPDLTIALVSIGRGARIGAVLGEFAGPEAVPVGVIAGAAIGFGVYAYDRYHNGQLSRNRNAGAGQCPARK